MGVEPQGFPGHKPQKKPALISRGRGFRFVSDCGCRAAGVVVSMGSAVVYKYDLAIGVGKTQIQGRGGGSKPMVPF